MKLLTKKQVCDMIGVSRAYVDRLTSDENYKHYGFPKPMRLGVRVLWPDTEVLAWIEKRLGDR